MSRRLHVTLPEPVAEQLRDLAELADQPPGRLAGTLLQKAIAQARRNGLPACPPSPPSPPLADTGHRDANATPGERPPWLQPYENPHAWRALAWGAIAALHSRYPRQLEALQENWWEDNDLLERLCAVAHWRQQLDEHASDPREEIYFHDTLANLARFLSQQPGTHGKWDPNVIPAGWIR